MCNTWQFPSDPQEEVPVEYYERLPQVEFLNITGGEPFIRQDLGEIIKIVKPKAKRICISTNGYFTDRVISLAEKHRDLGFRISLEGLPAANDELRGMKDGFDHGLRTLLQLHRLGVQDIGFGITVSDRNHKDLLELYELAKWLNVEFATAALHNGYYFHKLDNSLTLKDEISDSFRQLIRELFKTRRPKNWFRAYFNHGLINYVNGGKRLLPCEMGTDIFMVDPFGEIYPCNVYDVSMGNIKDGPWEQVWNSPKANEARAKAHNCGKDCWMIGSASPAIKKDKWNVIKWIIKNKWSY
jgi:MoaA/NifB/PqqE/SkfB family radical SAM enzyme